eukprot:4315797-Amphidinium_carterae.4
MAWNVRSRFGSRMERPGSCGGSFETQGEGLQWHGKAEARFKGLGQLEGVAKPRKTQTKQLSPNSSSQPGLLLAAELLRRARKGKPG